MLLVGVRGQALAWCVALLMVWAHATTPPPAVDNEAAGRTLDEVLQNVHHLSSGSLGTACAAQPFYRIAVNMNSFEATRQKVDLLVNILSKRNGEDIAKVLVGSVLRSEGERVRAVRVLSHHSAPHDRLSLIQAFRPSSTPALSSPFPSAPTTQLHVNTTLVLVNSVSKEPWSWGSVSVSSPDSPDKFQGRAGGTLGLWTFPYFLCDGQRWLVSYTAPLPPTDRSRKAGTVEVVSIEIDLTSFDINQCGAEEEEEEEARNNPLAIFRDSHKCERNTSKCFFEAGHGWKRGSYVCECVHGYFPQNTTFKGKMVEVAWDMRQQLGDLQYDHLYTCRKCPEHCPDCTKKEPCDAPYNWPFRIALLSISLLCILFTFVLMALVCHYRSVKVFRFASPTFLCICLIGCIIMYLEMAAIFPVLDTYSCVATKWTRHLGFCITFSSLLMKTWRVSLTYRVTSAHKIKLTDKQLLQWLTPILLIMLVYLGAWSLSATPSAEVKEDRHNLKYKQCKYDGWDHSLAAGEVLFLMWGVKVCFSVRKAESFFNEAKYISWAVYNIAVVNIVMVAFHLLIFPKEGPDIKYLFGFLRTQLSTSTTVLLIFGPKFYRIVQGTGDQYDNRARAKGVTASFSLNGLGVMNDEPADLSQENEELKEEIQKLAAQMEFMKIVHMEMNNRHLKPKPSGYFSEKNPVMAGPTSPRTDTPSDNPPAKLSSPVNEVADGRV